jgi:hypothetical protein
VRFNRRSPSNFMHLGDLACGEVGTPEVYEGQSGSWLSKI